MHSDQSILCYITTPILWENPFFIKVCLKGHSYNFIDTYFLFINEDDKTKLKELGITINSPFRRPLFNYPGFIKTLDTIRMKLHTINWMNNNLNILPNTNPKLTCAENQGGLAFQPCVEYYSFKIKNDSEEIMNFICISLF